MKKFCYLSILIILYSFCVNADNNRNLIFIRHGTTDWTWEMMAEGTKDLPLNQVGKNFIEDIADKLILKKETPPNKIISSPLLRCKETAYIIQSKYLQSTGKKIPILINKEIQGPNYGSWSKKSKKDISKVVQNIKKRNLSPFESKKLLVEKLKDFPKNDKEPWEDFVKRAVLAVEKIEKTYKGNLIIVTHGSFCEEYLKAKDKHLEIGKDYWKADNRPPLVVNYSKNNIIPTILNLK